MWHYTYLLLVFDFVFNVGLEDLIKVPFSKSSQGQCLKVILLFSFRDLKIPGLNNE